MNEQDYDVVLNVKTGEDQKRFFKSFHYHPYEPTPYRGLDILFDQYELKTTDHLVDFGCGKGRLNFYAHYRFHTKVTGIEMNEIFYKKALENLKRYEKKRRVREGEIVFRCCLAEEYRIQKRDNKFYFFNPFSIQIFRRVIGNILESNEQENREIDLILYYGADDYIDLLERETQFSLKQEIIIPELYNRDSYERFLIYTL
ncbi:SAM-dependent methyltransferase [Niallia sp. Krafla_26]|uniref:SAM-dependent methyltransferase n=1 Tax=Niallia sp. Krafla_26 TaxID=3064703 RepID=UPI003D1753C6